MGAEDFTYFLPEDIRAHFDRLVDHYNRPDFIEADPISIPHRFSRKQDIEIAGFWVAILAWGQRKTIINKGLELMERMDWAPYDFILGHREEERQKLLDFKHRTFNATDTLWFLESLQHYYRQHESLETAFLATEGDGLPVEKGLEQFRQQFFFREDHPARTRKHIASPLSNATCKRLNMFLRWMVRQDDRGVDFGIWQAISPRDLLIPLDVHVDKVARRYQLLQRPQTDWKAVLELTELLRSWDPEDPVKYDFALFGLGAAKNDPMP